MLKNGMLLILVKGFILDLDTRMKKGEHVPNCLVKTLLEARDEEALDHLDMSILCSAFMIGGVETVSPVLTLLCADF